MSGEAHDAYVKSLMEAVARLRAALADLLHGEETNCRLDHEGYCQNHKLDHVPSVGCSVQKARAILKSTDGLL
jgi:hypothetical protein